MDKKFKYVIKVNFPSLCNYYSYVGEGEYIFQGDHYKVIVENILDAKKYSSYNRAKNSMEKMLNKFINLSELYEIIQVSEV